MLDELNSSLQTVQPEITAGDSLCCPTQIVYMRNVAALCIARSSRSQNTAHVIAHGFDHVAATWAYTVLLCRILQ